MADDVVVVVVFWFEGPPSNMTRYQHFDDRTYDSMVSWWRIMTQVTMESVSSTRGCNDDDDDDDTVFGC